MHNGCLLKRSSFLAHLGLQVALQQSGNAEGISDFANAEGVSDFPSGRRRVVALKIMAIRSDPDNSSKSMIPLVSIMKIMMAARAL